MATSKNISLKHKAAHYLSMGGAGIIVFSLIAILAAPKLYGAGFPGNLHGFAEFAYGARFGDSRTDHPHYNLFEQRGQLKFTQYPEKPAILADWNSIFTFKGEFLLDEYRNGSPSVFYKYRKDESRVSLYLRGLNMSISPTPDLDLKVGRQILTWGTGDYLFINDVFPKDYVSFFSGRDDEYLKAPSWAVKASYFGKLFWTDAVIIPVFEENRIADGSRLSFYDPFQARYVGKDSSITREGRPSKLRNTQEAFRFYGQRGSTEWAFYLYHGFYTNPRGVKNPYTCTIYYPKLNVYGFSMRGPFIRGIASLEVGYLDSREDRAGDNPFIPNPSIKTLFGYSQDMGNDLTLGFQWQYEQMLKYGRYKRTLPPGSIRLDEHQHLFTFSVNKKFLNQTLYFNNFLFYSPTDKDGYFRTSMTYDVTDNTKVTLGANYFWGDYKYTEFGQLKNNKNIYLRLRYSF